MCDVKHHQFKEVIMPTIDLSSSAKVHNSLAVNSDGSYELKSLDGLTPEQIDGF